MACGVAPSPVLPLRPRTTCHKPPRATLTVDFTAHRSRPVTFSAATFHSDDARCRRRNSLIRANVPCGRHPRGRDARGVSACGKSAAQEGPESGRVGEKQADGEGADRHLEGNEEEGGGKLLEGAGDDVIAEATAALIGQDPLSAVKGVEAEVEKEERTAGETGAGDAAQAFGPELQEIYATCKTWEWRGHAINYATLGSGQPIVLVHGFGASIGHFRKNMAVLAESHRVIAIDLLGQGASAKPPKFQYTIETWAELLVDFLREVVGEPAVLVGNSIGSLAALCASAEAEGEGLVRGAVLLNCAGGMNNKAIVDDWRIRLAYPIFALIDFLLLQPPMARRLFDRVRSRQNVRMVLKSVYGNKDQVDEELVEVILRPALDPGALDAFVSIITGPPGPRPEALVPRTSRPLLLLWGDRDPFTPIDGPVGRFFRDLPEQRAATRFVQLAGVGHCPHDDDPGAVHSALLPWLAELPA